MLTNQPRTQDRRRSSRIAISIPLSVSGKKHSGGEFHLETRTHTVSEFGCLILLDAEVFLDQPIKLQRPGIGKSVEGKVVSTWRHPDGNHFVGISFTKSAQDFWLVPFAQK
jgi:hypothetical protein